MALAALPDLHAACWRAGSKVFLSGTTIAAIVKLSHATLQETPRPAATVYEINAMAAPGHALGHPVFLEFTAMVACCRTQHAAQTHLAGVARLLFFAALMVLPGRSTA